MGGVSYEDEFEFPTSLSNEDQARTVVLLGKTGNGKSATGNSIIGKKVFESKISYAGGVTTTCEMQSTIVKDTNRVINVIDTPGLFYYPGGAEYIEKEIVKCIDMEKDGIHSFLVVISVMRRFFSREEKGVVESLKKLFGNNISSYMIVVFTCGDDFEEDETLYDYLRGSPDSWKEILKMCGNRYLLFDNMTENAAKKSEQLHQLLALVDAVVDNNGGKPYTKVSTVNNGEMKKNKQECLTGVGSSEKDMPGFKEQLRIITEMVELKLRVATGGLEEQLAKERAARLKAEADAKDALKKSEEEIRVLRGEKMEGARLEEIDALKKTEEKIRVLRGKMERARLRAEIDALKKNEEICNLRGELERARLKAEAETKDAQHKADEELRILRGELESARLRAETETLRGELERARLRAEAETKDAQHKADEELRILRDELERAEKEAEKERTRKEADEELRILRDNLERAEKEVEKERAEKEAKRERAEKEVKREKARKEAEEERARKERARKQGDKDAVYGLIILLILVLLVCFLFAKLRG